MKFRCARKEKFSATKYYKGRKNGFVFIYSLNRMGEWYFTANHAKKNIRFNSLWSNITYETETEVQEACEIFDHRNYKCFGNDV